MSVIEGLTAEPARGRRGRLINDFKNHNVKVVTLSNAQYDTWLDLAKKSSYKKFAADVSNGQKLIDEALAVN